jgi:nitric oxide reductase NorQ protein
VALTFDYPKPEDETRIVASEGKVDDDIAALLVRLAGKIRNIREHGLSEGASTRLLIYAASLIREGIPFKAACTAAVLQPLTDDDRIQETLTDLIDDLL